MRCFNTICALASLATVAFAGDQGCLDIDAARQVADNFGGLISNYSATAANETLTRSYIDYSDSVIELINSGCTGPLPLGTPVFGSRSAFEEGQSTQPPIPFHILNLWHNCDTVFMRWRSRPGPNAPEEVTGIVVLETVPSVPGSRYPHKIETVYSEFNSGAWLVDLGVFVPTCNATATNATKTEALNSTTYERL